MSDGNGFLMPVLLDLRGKSLLFVGAGKGTATKLRGLMAQFLDRHDTLAPHITIIAPSIAPEVQELLREWPAKTLHERKFETTDLDGVDLVWALTDDADCNAFVARESAARHIFASASGNRNQGGFTQPAATRADDLPDSLIIAVSTSDRNPALAVKWRDRIKDFVCSFR